MQFSRLTMAFAALAASVSGAAVEERDLKACSSALFDALSAVTDIPTPASTLAEYLATDTQFNTVSDSCALPTITGSMASEYSSYASKFTSWQMSYKDEISDVLSACSDVSEVKSQLSTLSASANACPTYYWVGQSAAAVPAAKTGSNAESTQTNSDNAAPRETGMVVAAAAVAGMVVAGIY